MTWPVRRIPEALLLLVLAVSGQPTNAQTPMSIVGLSGTREFRQPLEAAPNNPWALAGQVGFKIAGPGDFEDKLLVSGKTVYDLPLIASAAGGWHVPIVTNFASLAADVAGGKTKADSLKAASQALASTVQGIHVGLYPYYVIHDGLNSRQTFFFSTVAKANALPLPDSAKTKTTMLQGRISIGAELALGSAKDSPLTLSAALSGTFFSGDDYSKIFGERKTHLYGFESTLIIPVKSGLAGILELVTGDVGHAVRFGIVVVPPSKAEKAPPAAPVQPVGDGAGAGAGAMLEVTVTPTVGSTGSAAITWAPGDVCTVSDNDLTKVCKHKFKSGDQIELSAIRTPNGKVTWGGKCTPVAADAAKCKITVQKDALDVTLKFEP